MNLLLSLNKKIFLFFTTIFFIIIFFIFVYLSLKTTDISKEKFNADNSVSDISKPKFSINSTKQNISVTAKKGNFLTEDEIMLEKNVIFESSKFKIYTDYVIFNKKTLVASSKNKSKFISNKTSIDSNGFEIIENGNIINFKGNTKLILK